MLVNLEPASNIKEANFDAPENAPPPMLVTFDGMVMEVKLDAPWNMAPSMLVTPDGIVTEVSADAP